MANRPSPANFPSLLTTFAVDLSDLSQWNRWEDGLPAPNGLVGPYGATTSPFGIRKTGRGAMPQLS